MVETTDVLDMLRHNLAVVLDALRTADAEHFMVRSRFGERPVVGVVRDSLATTLATLRDDAPRARFAAVEGPDLPRRVVPVAALLRLDPEEISWVEVFHHHVDDQTGRRFRDDCACTLEIFDQVEGGWLHSASPRTPRARHVSPQHRADPRPTTAYGLRAATVTPFTATSPLELDQPIDAVYLWVDDNDSRWDERRRTRLTALGEDPGDASPCRFRQFDELRYSLRSLSRYAPWIRRVFLVTDQQRPAWLEERDTNLTVVDHRDILPADALPTFNSHAITAAVHRIDGLSDRFLLMNDDVLLGRPLPPERFFHANGTARFFLSRTDRSPTGDTPLDAARRGTADLIESMTGERWTRVLKHTPIAMIRPWMEELAAELGDRWTATERAPFRTRNDLVPEWLHHFVGHARGHTLSADIGYGYLALDPTTLADDLAELGRRSAPDVFCVNDVGAADDGSLDAALASFLDHHLPGPSPYEALGRSGQGRHASAPKPARQSARLAS